MNQQLQTTGIPRRMMAAVVIMLVAAGLIVGFRANGNGTTELTLHFEHTTGLYVGNNVEIIGVPVGTVTDIAPNGPQVDVTIELDSGITVAADAHAVIMQSALVTDRFVELTPAWTEGPALQDGDVIGIERTHSPANYDDIIVAVNDLIDALGDTSGDHHIGDVLAVAAEQFEGKGELIADSLTAASRMLEVFDGRHGDIHAVAEDLNILVALLAERDDQINRLADAVAFSTALFADRRDDFSATLEALHDLSVTTGDFLERNTEAIDENLVMGLAAIETIAGRDTELGEAFDLLPLVAENLTRAYDPELRRTRIRVDLRNSGPFSPRGREDLCILLGVHDLCEPLLNADGTGLLDPIFEWITLFFPEDL